MQYGSDRKNEDECTISHLRPLYDPFISHLRPLYVAGGRLAEPKHTRSFTNSSERTLGTALTEA